MAKNRNQGQDQGQDQGQVKSKGEEEKKKPSLGSRIRKYIPWRIGLTIAAFLIPIIGPIIGTLVGILAYGHYRKKNRTDSTPKPGNENDKSNNEKNKEESKKQSTQPPGLGKKALYRAGAIAAGFMLGGPIGAVIAGIFVAIDIMSNGKVIQGVEKLLDASYGALSWLGKKALGIGKWAVDKMRSSEQGQEAAQSVAGKEQVEGRGVTEEKLGRNGQNGPSTPGEISRSVDGNATDMSTKVKRQAEKAAAPLVQAANPVGGVKAEGTTAQLSSSNGQGVNGNATNMSTEVKSQVKEAAAPLVEAQNNPSAGGVEVAKKSLQQPSPGEMQRSQSVDRLNGTGHQQSNKATSKTTDNIDDRGLRERADKLMENLRQPSTGGPSTPNQPVPPKTQGQAAQPAKSEDGVKAGGTKTNREVIGDATERLSKKDSANQASVVSK